MKITRLLPALLLVLSVWGLFLAGYAYAEGPPIKQARYFEFYASWFFFIWGASLVLHWLLLASFPNRTERLSSHFERSPWKSLLIGIVNLFIIAVILGVTFENAQPLAMILTVIALIVLFIGIHGRSRALGRRILRASGHEPGTFAEITIGWSAVAFLCAIPFLGWFVLAVYFYAGGLGALTLSIFRKPAAKGGVDLDSHEL